MAIDLVVDIEGLPGESLKADHVGQIDIDGWSLSANSPGAFRIGGGGGTGAANISDLHCTKLIDKASPLLLDNCLNHKHYKTLKVFCRKGGETPLNYLEITLTNVVISSIAQSISEGAERGSESLTFNFAKIKMKYYEQSAEGNVTDGPEMEFDVQSGKSV